MGLRAKRAAKKYAVKVERSAFNVHNTMADADNWEVNKGPHHFYSSDEDQTHIYKFKKGTVENNKEAVALAKKKGYKGYEMPHHVELAVGTYNGPMHLGYSFVDRYANDNPYAHDLTNAVAFHKALLLSGAGAH